MEIPDPIKKQVEKKGGLEGIIKLMPEEGELRLQSKIHHSLSDPLRVKILNLLSIQPLCVCLIKEITEVADSKLSYHLSVLKENGMIEGEEQGNWIIYKTTKLGDKFSL